MSYNNIVIGIDELLLKGKNQNLFSAKLKKHIKAIFHVFHPHPTEFFSDEQRFTIHTLEGSFNEEDEVVKHLLKVPGVYSIQLAQKIEANWELIQRAVLAEVQKSYREGLTFKIDCKRSCKKFHMDSTTIAREMGGIVLEKFPLMKVDVKKPELRLYIRLLYRGVYIFSKSQLGVGGLPVGTTGHLLCLLSGGFDSPVASYLMAKRGCAQSFVFFHAYPFVGQEVLEKIKKLVLNLSHYQLNCPLYVVSFGKFQELIMEHCPPDYRTLLFRRFMVECASELAHKIGASALLTGDALGQVSSQTLPNMALVDSVTELPILRPLIGFNKIEIINLAKSIGTHDISIIPQDDACSIIAPKHPVTNPNPLIWKAFKEKHDFSTQIKECVETAVCLSPSWNGEFFNHP